MRKLLLLAVATGTVVLIQRRAARLGLAPSELFAAVAERGLGMLDAPPPPPKPSLWRRIFPARQAKPQQSA